MGRNLLFNEKKVFPQTHFEKSGYFIQSLLRCAFLLEGVWDAFSPETNNPSVLSKRRGSL
jgi:hypothetical protein